MPYRDNWTEAVSKEVLERAKGVVRALAGDALPEAPAGVDEHPHRHHHQQGVPEAVVTHQNERTLRHRPKGVYATSGSIRLVQPIR